MSFIFGSFLEVRGLGESTLELQTESRVGWRPGSKKNPLEAEADKTKYMVKIKSRRMRNAGHIARTEETRAAYTVLVGKNE